MLRHFDPSTSSVLIQAVVPSFGKLSQLIGTLVTLVCSYFDYIADGQPTTMPLNLKKFLESGRYADVEFQVKSEKFNVSKTFKAHKLLLALSSEAFEGMFYGEPGEQKDTVVVTDLHPDGFYGLLKYVYARKPCLINCVEALHTKAAAEKYQLLELVQDCEAYISRSLKPEGMCSVLDCALDCGYAVPDAKVDAWLTRKAEAVLSSEAFVKSSVKTVDRVLDKVANVPELFVVHAVLKWTHAHCQKLVKDGGSEAADLASTFSQFRHKLRFLALTPPEFLEFVTSKEARGVIETADAFAILSNLIQAGCVELPRWVCDVAAHRVTHMPASKYASSDDGYYGGGFTAEPQKRSRSFL
ncbi:BTB/POZ domain-containing protein 3-like [Rhipicephalus sanguineus]|uniref:BTB/POZ domain-containing protein 3-like n=1 Tax=Rhipicephalus sanguineus TaxID=34632 RepID=UPI0018936672|nr:BTB/POZ domain-containing protein 3-like [Rhipicephalus sanguineus]